MPTYVYHCDTCDTNFEAVQKFSDNPLTNCPEGHEGVRRVITPSAIIFKGSGWYITDSKKGGSSGATVGAKSAETSSSGENGSAKSDSSESKSDAKPESKTDSKSSTAVP